MESLQAHLQALLQKVARTDTWRSSLGTVPLLRELERRVEAAHPDEDEERISARCHRRLRKLGNALRCGWELELLGRTAEEAAGASEEEAMDYSALLNRLETLGAAKQEHYRHIKAGDRAGPAALMQQATGEVPEPLVLEAPPLVTTPDAYSSAVAAQRNAMWHRQAMAAVVGVLQASRARHVIDIGSSFNPLRGHFPHVTALDPLPQDPSVLTADFFEVDIVEGLASTQSDPLQPERCVAVPAGFYDAGLLSLVLRSLRSVPARRRMVRRAARTLRKGGLLLVVEKNNLASLIKYEGPEDTPWKDAGLQRRKTIGCARAVLVNVFERVDDGAR